MTTKTPAKPKGLSSLKAKKPTKKKQQYPSACVPTLLLDEKDEPVKKSTHNAMVFLKHHPDLAGKLAFDKFKQKFMVLGSLPHETRFPRELNDYDSTQLTGWLELQGLRLQEGAVWKAIQAVAYDNQFDPLTDYLGNLEWDGVNRVGSWLCDYLGADKTPYTEIIGRCFLIGAIARALKPGCKNDTMLILEGEQGAQKSTALKTLFGANFFTDEIAKFGSKDAGMQVQGVWCIEAAELTTMGKAETSDIKAFLSRSTDRFREPYGRVVTEHKRRCIVAGTINPDGSGYLKDTTGGRRFWPVEVKTINIELLEKDRDQLWAEAKTLFNEGAKWWLEPDQEITARLAQEERTQDDPWIEQIRKWIESSPVNKPHSFSTTVTDILTLSLDLPKAQQDQRAANRVAQCLKRMGYRVKVTKNAERKSVRTYIKD